MIIKKVLDGLSKWQVQFGILLIQTILSIWGLVNFLNDFKQTQTNLTQDTFAKQDIIVRAGALALEHFIYSIQDQLDLFVFSFAKTTPSSPIDLAGTQKEFFNFINRSAPPIAEIALYDENGKLIILENRQQNFTGVNEHFSDQDFIRWSKDPNSKGLTYITSPYISKAGWIKGSSIIAIATPLYFGNRFKGTVAIRILAKEFQSTFIETLSPLIEDSSFISDKEGTVISGDNRILALNLIDYAKASRWPGYEDFIQKYNQTLSSDRQNITWAFKYPLQNQDTYLVSSAKIDIPNTDKDLYLIVATSQKKFEQSVAPIKYYTSFWIWLIIIITFMLNSLYLVVRNKLIHLDQP